MEDFRAAYPPGDAELPAPVTPPPPLEAPPTLWEELAEGTAGPVVRAFVSAAMAPCSGARIF